MVDLDMALVLLSQVPVLYGRLDDKSKARLLMILAKRIIINPDGQIVDYELNSPFTYLRSLAEGFEILNSGPYRDSEQVLPGAQKNRSFLGSVFVLIRGQFVVRSLHLTKSISNNFPTMSSF